MLLLLISSRRGYPGVSDPFIAEALACRDSLWLARRGGFRQMSLETDCQEVVIAWERQATGRSAIATILS